MTALKSGMLTASLLSAFALAANAQQRVVDADAVAPPATEDTGYYKASDLIGMEVRGTDNQDLGEVQDLFIDRMTNEIEYLILDTGVFADLDGKQPIVPWVIVNMQSGAAANTYFLSIPLTQERIKAAPTIVLTDVDLVGSRTWVTQVDEFYVDELKERRVSRPDLDQNRDRATSRQNRDGDRTNSNRPQRRSNAGNSPDASDKQDTPAQPKADKPTKPRAESSATPDAQPNPVQKPKPAPAPEKTEKP